jgi:hypothetical protein
MVVFGVQGVTQQAVIGGLRSAVGRVRPPQRPPVQLLGEGFTEGGFVRGHHEQQVALDRDPRSPTMIGV